jgi:hypothetical protein
MLSQPFIAPSTFLQLGPDRLIASFTAAAPASLAGLVANLVLEAWGALGTRRGLARKTRGSRLPRQKDWRPVGGPAGSIASSLFGLSPPYCGAGPFFGPFPLKAATAGRTDANRPALPYFCRPRKQMVTKGIEGEGYVMTEQNTAIRQQPGPVRRTIGFLIALALAVGGASSVIVQLSGPDRIFGKLLIGACAAAIGAYWLWVDYINTHPNLEE